MSRVEIDWSSAEVHDGELTVALTDAASPAWRRRFDAVLPQLSHGGTRWERVAAKKRRLVVSGVAVGTEADVRLLLESLVRAANAAEPGASQEPGDATDARMTEAFRAFAAHD